MIVYRRGRWSPVAGSFELPSIGAFTTLAIRTSQPLFFREHIRRLEADAHRLGLKVDAGRTLRTLRRGIARFNLTRGVARLVLSDTGDLTITLEPPRSVPRSIRLLLTEHKPAGRRDLKLAAWQDGRRAYVRAQQLGCFDALLVDGCDVLESSRANLLVVRGDRVLTPPEDGRILPGIARRLLLASGVSGLSIRRVARSSLKHADAVLLISSVRGVLEVAELINEKSRVLWTATGQGDCVGELETAWRRIIRSVARPRP